MTTQFKLVHYTPSNWNITQPDISSIRGHLNCVLTHRAAHKSHSLTNGFPAFFSTTTTTGCWRWPFSRDAAAIGPSVVPSVTFGSGALSTWFATTATAAASTTGGGFFSTGGTGVGSAAVAASVVASDELVSCFFFCSSWSCDQHKPYNS